MSERRYEFVHAGWRQRLPSIGLRVVCGLLLIFFSFDTIAAISEVDRARSLSVTLFLAVFYCNIDNVKHDIQIFFEQPVNVIGIPLLLINAGLGFYSVYLNA